MEKVNWSRIYRSLRRTRSISPSSPLIVVVRVEELPNSVTLLIRGRMDLFKGLDSAFVRIQVIISKDIDLSLGDVPIKILKWQTIMIDAKIKEEKVFEASLALGNENDVWVGRGALKILPAGFGLDIFLGGLNKRGAMIGIDADFPAPIPLGPFLGFSGIGGDFASNFIPRLEKDGVSIPDPTAENYADWAKNTEVDRWKPGPVDQTSVGLGIRADLKTLFDYGWMLKLEPVGLAILTPGPVLVLGGKGHLFNFEGARVEGYVVIDINSESLAFDLSANLKVPDSDADNQVNLLTGQGTLDAYFSFQRPSTWFLKWGIDTNPVSIKVLNTLLRAEAFLMADSDGIQFGAGISLGGSYEISIIKLVAILGARVQAGIGVNPFGLVGRFAIYGELGIRIWKFAFILTGQAETLGRSAQPTILSFKLRFKINLPWPIPDVEGEKEFSYSDEQPQGPILRSPMLVGQAEIF